MRNRTAQPTGGPAAHPKQRLPLAPLAALATASFITVLAEALPGGLLPTMSSDLRVSESAMGQAVTIYAIGSAVAAIPLSAATSGWRRKRLLLATMAGFAVANTLTAVSDQYLLTMVGRFIAGVCGGLVWAMMAGYARRMVPNSLHGKAIAVAMAGTPLSLALGVPAGTLLGQALGWRVAFLTMSVIAVAVLGWLQLTAPDFPGEHRERRSRVAHTVRVPGVTPVLLVVLTVVLAHTILYTYIATFLDKFGMVDSTAPVLFVFGTASVAAISFVGSHIYRHLRRLTITGTLLFAAGANSPGNAGRQPEHRVRRSGPMGTRIRWHGDPPPDSAGSSRRRGRGHRSGHARHLVEHRTGFRRGSGWSASRRTRRGIVPLVGPRDPRSGSAHRSHREARLSRIPVEQYSRMRLVVPWKP